ncbi:uncharacterized protein B0I36DRAFT_16805 [Microdochium trichocladiopsis]|uniref:Uncharacterized protein n=1 Tax=Microdochium trichocladiopsis TaxID=1682393 RepID=A0A9P8YKZ1_9PEZI|nr:uncharacterized protein B0I36DRAFT_16805 [Microdochium trichocladiopsis]KAH7040915.1 hypothetical protein B0I36DRAFT_16805 [Microdochium trichocladiopsis]
MPPGSEWMGPALPLFRDSTTQDPQIVPYVPGAWSGPNGQGGPVSSSPAGVLPGSPHGRAWTCPLPLHPGIDGHGGCVYPEPRVFSRASGTISTTSTKAAAKNMCKSNLVGQLCRCIGGPSGSAETA